MHVQLNTDANIEGREKLADYVKTAVETALGRYGDRITRIEVHLGDENGKKVGHDDKRCMMEARLAGREPMAVTHHAGSIDQAIDGALHKLSKSVESTLDRLAEHR